MSTWLLRIAVLLAIPAALAVVDANKRPLPAPTAAPPPSENVTAGEGGDSPAGVSTLATAPAAGLTLEVLAAHVDAGTAMIVDARPAAEYAAGHIPGAFHLAPESFRLGKLEVLNFIPPEEKVIVYCGGGDCDASHMVQKLLRAQGYQDVEVFEQGFPAWQEAGNPVEVGGAE